MPTRHISCLLPLWILALVSEFQTCRKKCKHESLPEKKHHYIQFICILNMRQFEVMCEHIQRQRDDRAAVRLKNVSSLVWSRGQAQDCLQASLQHTFPVWKRKYSLTVLPCLKCFHKNLNIFCLNCSKRVLIKVYIILIFFPTKCIDIFPLTAIFC